MDDYFFVYMLTNKWRKVLYTGLTDSLESRLSQHKDKIFDGTTGDKLVYFEIYDNAEAAALREKQIKFSATWRDIKGGILRFAQDNEMQQSLTEPVRDSRDTV